MNDGSFFQSLTLVAKDLGPSGGALIAGVFAVFAYLLKSGLEAILVRNTASRRRLELVRAVSIDARETIESYSAGYWPKGLPESSPEHPKEIMARLFAYAKTTNVPYIPFIVFAADNNLSKIVEPELHKLPSGLMETIASYYHQDRLLQAMIADLRSTEFKSLTIERQESVVNKLFSAISYAIAISEKILVEAQRYQADRNYKLALGVLLGGLSAITLILVGNALFQSSAD